MTLLDGEKLTSFLLNEKISEIQFTPSAVTSFLDFLEKSPTTFSDLKCVWLCGEVVRGNLARRLSRVISEPTRLINLYSISEAPDIAVGDLRRHHKRELHPLTRFLKGVHFRSVEKKRIAHLRTIRKYGWLLGAE